MPHQSSVTMRRLLNFLLMMCIALSLCAQQPHEQTNAGTDFWVTDVVASFFAPDEIADNLEQTFTDFEFFLHTPDSYADTAVILIVGNSPCSGYAENVNTGWRTDFLVTPGALTEIKVPEEEIMCYINQGVQQKGIYVHTESEVYAYLITRSTQDWLAYGVAVKNTPQKFQIPPAQAGVKEANLPISLGISHANECCSDIYISDFIDGLLSLSYLVVGMEDHTDVTVSGHYEASAPLYDTSTHISITWVPDTSYTLQRGEVLVIPFVCSENGPIYAMNPPRAMDMEIHTNCKMVSVYQHRTFRYTWGMLPFESVAPYHPDLFGRDFLDMDEVGSTVVGRLQSRQCHGTEDAPKFSNRIYHYDSLNTFYERDICQCSSSFAYTVIHTGQEFAGSLKFIYNTNPLMPTEMLAVNQTGHHPYQCIYGAVTQLLYADKQVKEVLFPIQHDEADGEVVLFIATSPQGRFTTFVNGELLPDTSFIIDDPQSGQYYVAILTYQGNEIPEVIKIENNNGFSAQLQEIRQFSDFDNINWATATISNSGCTYNLTPIQPNIGTGVTTFCANDTLRVYTEGNCENYPITWTVDDSTFTLFDDDVLIFPFSVVDTLHLTMVVEKNCPDTLIDTVYVVLNPHITLPTDTIICRGATITAQSDMFGFWQWSDGTEGATITPQEEGDYTVRIDNACGSDSATIHVRFYDTLALDFGNDTLLCELATLLLDANQQHPASYTWQDLSTNSTYTVINDGRYWVVVDDGCAGTSDTIDVTYLYDLRIDLGPDTTVCSDQHYLLDATTPYSHYLWHDGTTAPTHEVTTPGTYSVHVYNVCTEADASVTIEVEECEEAVHVPNAFPPNGDGQNDLFLPVFNHPERLESYSMQVYDRWGRLLFSTDNPQQGWDCSECPVGVYVWRMEYKAAGEGSKLLTGSVTVVK